MCFGKGAYLLCNEELNSLQEESGACGTRNSSGNLQRYSAVYSSRMHLCHYAEHQCQRPCTGINW